MCESVGVLDFHSRKYPAIPRIYPWEATLPPHPTNSFVGVFMDLFVVKKPNNQLLKK